MDEIDKLDPKSIFIFHLDDVEDVPKEAITDAQRLMPGKGILPLTELCRRLKAIGFDGLASVELFRPEYWSWPAEEVAVTARRAALSVLSPHWPNIE